MRRYRRRSRFAVEDLVVINGPLCLFARLGGSLNILENWIVRIDLVVQDKVPGRDSQCLLHGKLVLLSITSQKLVLCLVQLCLSHLHSYILHITCHMDHLKGISQRQGSSWMMAYLRLLALRPNHSRSRRGQDRKKTADGEKLVRL